MVSPGFSASAPHIPHLSLGSFTTHTPAKASRRRTAPHRLLASAHTLHKQKIYNKECFLKVCDEVYLLPFRLQLHHVQCLLQYSFSHSRHHRVFYCQPGTEKKIKKIINSRRVDKGTWANLALDLAWVELQTQVTVFYH